MGLEDMLKMRGVYSGTPSWVAVSSVFLLLCSGGVQLAVATPKSFRLTVTGPRVAAQSIVYELEQRYGTFTVRRTENLGFGYPERSDLSLLPATQWKSWWRRLTQGLDPRWHSSQPARGRMVYTLDIAGDRPQQIRLLDPAVRADQAPWRLVSTFMRLAESAIVVPPDWDRRLLVHEAGALRIESRPRAKIIIDGVELRRSTPVRAMMLAAGSHQVVLVHPKTGEKWQYAVQIKAEATTFLNVHLQ
ncbi:MAG: PEGA domain-containing protein [Myxococcota bacterium]|nr:PEGA domain-containing protein [Myxococcota bacterium]